MNHQAVELKSHACRKAEPGLPLKRRAFFKLSGVSLLAAAGTAFAGKTMYAATGGNGVYLGTGDVAVLNFAFVLEQLEAEFYTLVTKSFYRGISGYERMVLTDLRDHEVAHRDFYRATLGASGIPNLQFDFRSVDFSSRQSVLTVARMLEDNGVSAYNGAGQLLTDPHHLMAAGKIASVEGRHAAIIRDVIQPNSNAFAGPGVVDGFGLDLVATPGEAMRKAAPFIVTPINASGLPHA